MECMAFSCAGVMAVIFEYIFFKWDQHSNAAQQFSAGI